MKGRGKIKGKGKGQVEEDKRKKMIRGTEDGRARCEDGREMIRMKGMTRRDNKGKIMRW